MDISVLLDHNSQLTLSDNVSNPLQKHNTVDARGNIGTETVHVVVFQDNP